MLACQLGCPSSVHVSILPPRATNPSKQTDARLHEGPGGSGGQLGRRAGRMGFAKLERYPELGIYVLSLLQLLCPKLRLFY